MISMHIILEGDNCWPDLAGKDIIHLSNDAPAIQVAVLQMGMATGRPSVALRIELPDGRTVVAETSARLFCMAAKAVMAKYPGLFDGD